MMRKIQHSVNNSLGRYNDTDWRKRKVWYQNGNASCCVHTTAGVQLLLLLPFELF